MTTELEQESEEVLTPEEKKRKDIQKRVAVYAKPRRTVLVKLGGIGVIDSLRKVKREEQDIYFKHVDEAAQRGLDARAYRRNDADSGHQWCENEERVYINRLLTDLKEAGLQYCGGHSHDREGRSPMNTLEFSSDAERWVEMPDAVRAALELRYQFCAIYCNLKYEDPEDLDAGQYRLDTVNMHGGNATTKPGQTLRLNGNTYALEAPVVEPTLSFPELVAKTAAVITETSNFRNDLIAKVLEIKGSGLRKAVAAQLEITDDELSVSVVEEATD